MELRPEQLRAVTEVREAFRKHSSVLLVAPCAFGKTITFSYICLNAVAKGKSVVILIHRAELLRQVSEALSEFGIDHGFIAAGKPYEKGHKVYVASVQTLARRIAKIPPPSLTICDESHHCVQGNTWGKIVAAWPSSKLLGVTATPCRTDSKGLGDIFQTMVLGPSTAEMIAMGRLTPAKVYAPMQVDMSDVSIVAGDYNKGQLSAKMDKPAIIGDAFNHWRKYANGKQTVVFCVSVEHAQHTAQRFLAEGVNAIAIYGNMGDELRQTAVDEFSKGIITVLVSVDLVNEGFNCPAIEAAISLRPTASMGLWIQQVGRCIRLHEGKKIAIIIDAVGNSHRHGLPDDDREWSLDAPAKRPRSTDTGPAVRQCKICFACMPVSRRECRECGSILEPTPREIEQLEGELQEVQRRQEQTERKQAERQARTLEDWQAIGRARGYAPGWAAVRYQLRSKRA